MRSGRLVAGIAIVGLLIGSIGASADSGTPFDDVDDNVHLENIVYVASIGVTRGCNPPENTRFCPADPVTRGQMAAFLARALGLTATGPGFVDSVGHVFENDISRLAAAGITKGCNPPINDLFCPDDVVTRGEMAAFLRRGFRLEPASTRRFLDTQASVFVSDIEAIAAVGVTVGCNPPANDRYCPDDRVRRDEMASFLARSLGIGGSQPPTTFDEDTTTTLEEPTSTSGGESTTSMANVTSSTSTSTSSTITTTTTSQPPADAARWVDLNDEGGSPTGRHENGFVLAENAFYLLGSRDGDAVDPAADVQRFRIDTRTWQNRPGPGGFHHTQPVAIGNLIYVLGAMGDDPALMVDPSQDDSPMADVHTYNIGSGAWTSVDPMRVPRGGAGAVYHEGYIYVVGGATIGHGSGMSGIVDRYHVASGAWEEMSSLEFARNHLQVVVVDHHLYAIGGRNGGAVKAIERYDLDDGADGEWETLDVDLPHNFSASVTVAIGPMIYVIGGEGNSQASGRVDRFDTRTETWAFLSDAPLSPPRHATGGAVCADDIYVAVGSPRFQGGRTTDFQALDTEGDGLDCLP